MCRIDGDLAEARVAHYQVKANEMRRRAAEAETVWRGSQYLELARLYDQRAAETAALARPPAP